MGDARLVFLSTAFLTIAFFYLGMKRYQLRYPGLVFFLYLLTIFPATMNAVRQGVAMSIMFYAFTFVLDKKPDRWIAISTNVPFEKHLFTIDTITKHGEIGITKQS